MTTQLTQGQQRQRTVNIISTSAFFVLLLLFTSYFIFPISSASSVVSFDYLFSILRVTAPAALFLAFYLHRILKSIYVRETGELAEGFYTQRSWLDVDDKVLVAVNDSDVAFFSIPEAKLHELQGAYQQEASFEALRDIAGVSAEKVTSIPMKDIQKMSSSHKKDTIELEIGDDYHSVEFLNVKTKQHALKRFQLLVSSDLSYRTTKPTRLKACFPWLVTLLAIALTIFLFTNAFTLAILGGVGFFLILPKMLRELIDPTQLEIWEKQDS